MSLNSYELADNKGRDIVISIFKNKFQFTPGGASDSFDLKTEGLNGVSLIEIKYRPTMKSSDYDTDILEYHKLSLMRNEDRKANYFYFMLFSDGIGRLYNLKDISIADVYLDVKDCPVSSTEDKGTVDKLMIELPATKAKVYKFNLN